MLKDALTPSVRREKQRLGDRILVVFSGLPTERRKFGLTKGWFFLVRVAREADE